MKLVPTNERMLFKKTALLSVLEEFENSGHDCVRIEDYPQSSAKTCYSSFYNAINRYHMNNIKVFTRRGEVYLVKEK